MGRLMSNRPMSDESFSPPENKPFRLGVFGGSFDPPHLGHLILAEEALYQLNLDQVLWVLTPNPPHKQERNLTPKDERFLLVQAAIQDQPRFKISRVEIDRSPPHFAVDTLKIIKEEFPEADLVYLIGGDSLHDLPRWRTPREIIQICKVFGVMRRPGDQVDVTLLEQKLPGLTSRLQWIDAPLLDISATLIRNKIQKGQSFRYYLHPAVYKIICEQCLFQ